MDSLSYTLMSSKVFTTALLKGEVLQDGEHLGHTVAFHLLPLHKMRPRCKQRAVIGSWIGRGRKERQERSRRRGREERKRKEG